MLYNFVTVTKLLSNSSYRPIHDLCLSSEAARVGKLLYVLKSVRATCFEIKTDSVLFQPLKRRPIDVSIIKYRDLDTLRAQYTDTPGIRKLDQYCLCTHIPSDRAVFRWSRATENDKLKVESSKTPKRLCRLKIAEDQWNQFSDNQAAEAHTIAGGSLLIDGAARNWEEFLRQRYCRTPNRSRQEGSDHQQNACSE